MSTRNDQDEPLATGEEGSSPDLFAVRRVNPVAVPSSAQPQHVTPVGENVRVGRDGSAVQPGVIDRSRNFILETRDEMHRVSWPSATEVKNTTIITIVAVIFFAAYLFVVDRSFTFLIEGLTSLLSRLV